jgi:hypothetical protein
LGTLFPIERGTSLFETLINAKTSLTPGWMLKLMSSPI